MGEKSPGLFLVVQGTIDMIFKDSDFVINSFSEQEYFGDVCLLNLKNQFICKSKSLSLCLFLPGNELIEILIEDQKQMQKCVNTALLRNKELIDIRKEVKKSFLLFAKDFLDIDPELILHQVQNSLLEKFPKLRPSILFLLPLKPGEANQEGGNGLSPGNPVFTTLGDELIKPKHDRPKIDLPGFLKIKAECGNASSEPKNTPENIITDRTLPPLTASHDDRINLIARPLVYESSVLKNMFMVSKKTEICEQEEVKTQRKTLRTYLDAYKDNSHVKDPSNNHKRESSGSIKELKADQISTPDNKSHNPLLEPHQPLCFRVEEKLNEPLSPIPELSKLRNSIISINNITAGFVNSDVIFI